MATSNELLLRFFRSEDDPLIPHRHEDVVCFSDNDLEWYHNFIQWIFPTWQPSGACPNAPTIDEHFAEQLCADKCALKNFCKSCQRYLNYMNIDCDGNSHIVDSTRSELFYELPYHNYLRFTRMLDSLNQTGHKQCSKAVYEKMFEVMSRNRNAWQLYLRQDSIKYWRQTQVGRKCRKIIFHDFDNTLFEPDYIAAINHVIDETKAEIVISSSWKIDMSVEDIQRMWKASNLPGIPIDVTPAISRHKGDEIAAWLTLCPDPCRYVIIDDGQREQFNTNQYPHLIITNAFFGLTMSLANKAIDILNNFI